MTSTLDWSRYRAALFDMDGVLTATARLHAACWKQVFDQYLRARADRTDGAFQEFEIAADYRRHVDGRRREDGVRAFLASRGIELPEGSPDSPADEESVRGLGTAKQALVVEQLRQGGVDVFPDAIVLVRALRERGIRTAVVSASANCQTVLAAAGIEGLFDARIDGVIAAERDLPGKPAPDTFLAAARELETGPADAVVLEDAIAGVQAGRNGAFGVVVGVARHGDTDELRRAGADIVVEKLTDLLG